MNANANAFLDQAYAHHAAGRNEAAVAHCRLALTADPALAGGHYLLGALTAQTGDGDGGATFLQRAITLNSTAATIRAQLALALLQARRIDESAVAARQALAVAPDCADACEALGLLRYHLADYAAAARFLLRAHNLRPQKTETLVNLGAALRDARLFDAAETVYSAAIARRPDISEAWLGRATTRLTRGDLLNGWDDFEHRWRRPFPQPTWDGRALNGEVLLLHAEQGFGDTLQFARYAPLAADRGARVIFEVHPALVRLLRRLDPRVRVHPSNLPLPAFDLQLPLMSAPRVFRATLDNIPPSPSLTLDPADYKEASARVRSEEGALNVGLCWAGNPSHRNDHNRSLPVGALGPLQAVSGVRLWSLQTGAAEGDGPAAVRPPPIQLRDFAATAAVVASLDLVVTVDTVIAHLAGALGIPCWVLLPFAPDWRWLVDRNDTPWHPSLRLIRQPAPNDWDSVVCEAARRLSAAVERRANPTG